MEILELTYVFPGPRLYTYVSEELASDGPWYVSLGAAQFEFDIGFLTENMMKRSLRVRWKSISPTMSESSLSSPSSHHL